jgi:hypothetical protein
MTMEDVVPLGYMGKIVEIDLDNDKIEFIPTEKYAQKFLGGRGIASRIYWEKVKPEIKAFDRENVLIFMTGPLVATSVQGASRLSVVSKSPMAYPEGYCYGDIGGFAGAELKRAGFDGIVISGISIYFRGYIAEKGRNTATKEDVKEITTKVEDVKESFRKEQSKFIDELQWNRKVQEQAQAGARSPWRQPGETRYPPGRPHRP